MCGGLSGHWLIAVSTRMFSFSGSYCITVIKLLLSSDLFNTETRNSKQVFLLMGEEWDGALVYRYGVC